jgi:Domain of unknown function (DUF1771)
MRKVMVHWLIVYSPSLTLLITSTELSEKGKLHDRAAKAYNQQAADFVFRANNARSAPDEIDLHGLYLIVWGTVS